MVEVTKVTLRNLTHQPYGRILIYDNHSMVEATDGAVCAWAAGPEIVTVLLRFFIVNFAVYIFIYCKFQ